jgi:hypothetical protein
MLVSSTEGAVTILITAARVNVVIQNVKAKGVSKLIGLNSNYRDTTNISGSCGSNVNKVCQEYKGVQKGNGDSEKVNTTANCKGQQRFPAC